MPVTSSQTRGAVCGLGAAALFGISAPVAKRMAPEVATLPLAALLYLGAFGALAIASLFRAGRGSPRREPGLDRRDLPVLGAVALVGGMLGPVLMLAGLSRVSGTTASLLLNLEGPLTVGLAVLVFGEHLGRLGLGAMAAVLCGSAVLGMERGTTGGDVSGIFAIAGACLCWAVDNNMVQRLSLRDPIAVVRAKAGIAGVGNLLLSLALQSPFPSLSRALSALALGAVCYGLSLLLDVYALRFVGAAREAAFFATAPFVGALASMAVLGERPDAWQAGAAVLLGIGVFLLLRERHGHTHQHETIEHEHLHRHDEHHAHTHAELVSEPHSHWHRHTALVHDHPHMPDLHHRHRH